ncbi:alpha-tocopherol transfer protein-like [Uranotaenia lowii]|uniref:alpha-tocopherol transfer protein-like n=1 Tax=Uranotaenia lowii TaxID=190385 RepID=UPI002479ABEB|nr:alpha-tocopherol transfer protein-like [Uranotaenia lowii]
MMAEQADAVSKSDIEAVQEWLKTQPHLPAITESDIKVFLHCNYQDVEAAKVNIEKYYTFRTSCTDFFTNRDCRDETIQVAMSLSMFSVLPKSTPEGYRVAYCRLLNPDTTNYVHLHAIRMLVMHLDLWMKEEALAPGHVILIDMTGMHLGHLSKIRMGVVKNYSYYTQEAIPIRLKQLHFLNVVSFMDKIMWLAKPFMKKEIMELIHMHTSIDTLIKYIPLDCLPQEYGGGAGPYEDLNKLYRQKLFDHREEFLEEERSKRGHVDESKRIAKPKRYMFGLFG